MEGARGPGLKNFSDDDGTIAGHANGAEGRSYGSWHMEAALQKKGQSSTITELCVLAVPRLADDSHFPPPSRQGTSSERNLLLLPVSIWPGNATVNRKRLDLHNSEGKLSEKYRDIFRKAGRECLVQDFPSSILRVSL